MVILFCSCCLSNPTTGMKIGAAGAQKLVPVLTTMIHITNLNLQGKWKSGGSGMVLALACC